MIFRIRKWIGILKANRKKVLIAAVILLVLFGIYRLVGQFTTYTKTAVVKDYSAEGEDNYSYKEFADGVVRYSKDGVIFLNQKNEEQWNQPAQFNAPMIVTNEKAFAVADRGGNSLMVFNKGGLLGEISTNLPIEQVAISNQGITAVILKQESSPKIVTYDIAGNVLVETQATFQNSGYPMAVALSEDANLMAVSYMTLKDGAISSRVVYYNFGSVGQSKTDNQVSETDYKTAIVPELFFWDSQTSVAVADDHFDIYEGTQIPEKKTTVKLDKEIRSSFHSKDYLGFILKNSESAGYELRLYNKNGKQILSESMKGEYGNVKISGKEVLLFEGSKAVIFTKSGHKKFQGDLGMETTEIVPLSGTNQYLLLDANKVKKVKLK